MLNEHNGAVNTLATHPYLHRILIGSYACKIKLWDYDTKCDVTLVIEYTISYECVCNLQVSIG